MMNRSLCLKCPSGVHCCRFKSSGFVFVGLKDALMISQKHCLGFADFMEWRQLPKKLISRMGKEPGYSEAFLRHSQLKKGKLPVLKVQKNGDCIFLKKGRCTIYEHRPLVCRIYPYWFYRGEKLHIIAHDENCNCRILKQKEGRADLKKKEIAVLRKIARKIEYESKNYSPGSYPEL